MFYKVFFFNIKLVLCCLRNHCRKCGTTTICCRDCDHFGFRKSACS